MSRVAIITGAGSGIGKDLSYYFAKKGWELCVADISEEWVKTTTREITPFNPQILPVKVDIRNADEVKRMIHVCQERYVRIDALINNAGITDKKHITILEVPYKLWHAILATNLSGSFACLRECAKYMQKQGWGNIVNITSLLGQRGYTRIGDTAYGVSKAALEALTEYASAELSALHINVNSAYPGTMVNTGFFDYLEKNESERLASSKIMNELVYVLCCLEPGELSGRSLCVQNWKNDPQLRALYRKYLGGEG